jgi:uncharacterized protein (TIGR00255 family)
MNFGSVTYVLHEWQENRIKSGRSTRVTIILYSLEKSIQMTQSMTAFGREEAQSPLGHLIWEIRSVNHRYQEISMRLPEDSRVSEPAFRQAIASVIKRGRIDAILHYQPLTPGGSESHLDHDEIRRLARWEAEVRSVIHDAAPLRAAEILRWPGVLGASPVNVDRLHEQALELLKKTLATVLSNRQREGGKLAGILRDQLLATRNLAKKAKKNWPAVEAHLRSRLEERIADFADKLDPGRLEQEVVLLLSKADIQEEADRLLLHLEESERVLAGDGPIGRRLDFLMQELHREANTLGSKSAHPIMTAVCVDLKVLIEQMREQVQNVE